MTGKVTTNSINFILIAVLIDAIGLGIIMPVLPELLKDLTGHPLNEAALHGGWLTFCYAIMQFIFMPIVGALSDAYGRRRVLLLSLFALGFDYLFMAVAPTIALLYVGRIISGATGATYATANAYIADIAPPAERAQKFGMIGAAFGVGFVLGPSVGGLLGEFGPRVPFYAAAIIALANGVYGLFFVPESLDTEHRRAFSWRRANPFGVLKKISAMPKLGWFLVALFLFSCAHFVYPSSFSFFTAEKFNWTPRNIGFALGAFGLASAVVQGGLIRIAIPKLGMINCAVIGIIMNACANIGLSMAGSAFIAYAYMIPAALGGLAGPAITNLMSIRVAKNAQGELQGATGALSGIAMLISPLAMTRLFHHYGGADSTPYFPGAPFMLAGLLTILGLLVFFWAVRHVPVIKASAE